MGRECTPEQQGCRFRPLSASQKGALVGDRVSQDPISFRWPEVGVGCGLGAPASPGRGGGIRVQVPAIGAPRQPSPPSVGASGSGRVGAPRASRATAWRSRSLRKSGPRRSPCRRLGSERSRRPWLATSSPGPTSTLRPTRVWRRCATAGGSPSMPRAANGDRGGGGGSLLGIAGLLRGTGRAAGGHRSWLAGRRRRARGRVGGAGPGTAAPDAQGQLGLSALRKERAESSTPTGFATRRWRPATDVRRRPSSARSPSIASPTATAATPTCIQTIPPRGHSGGAAPKS